MTDDETDRVDVLARRLCWARIAVVVLAIATGWLWYRQRQSEERRCAWTYDDVESLLSFVYRRYHTQPPGFSDSPEVTRYDNQLVAWTLDVLQKQRVHVARRRQQQGTVKECQ